MKLIVGLGNPGAQYERTRHNAGFFCLDFLRQAFHFPEFVPEKKFSVLLTGGTAASHRILLAKPETLMNRSGDAVKALADFYKIPLSDIALVHDDLDIAKNTFRLTDSSRAAGHNGVQDVFDKLGSQDVFRVRLGIGRPENIDTKCETSTHDFVLEPFSEDERRSLASLFPDVHEEILRWLAR